MRCALEVEPIRAEPRKGSEQVTQALRGEPLRVTAERAGWARVVTIYDYPGWIRAAALEPGEGSLPSARAGAPVDEAHAFLGAPYLWGGLTEHGIDCSGLVHMSYRRLGLLVPRDSADQEAAGMEMTAGKSRRGDLVTYGTAARCDHIAFWLGGGLILHATGRGGRGVVEEYEPKALNARRRRLIRLGAPSN